MKQTCKKKEIHFDQTFPIIIFRIVLHWGEKNHKRVQHIQMGIQRRVQHIISKGNMPLNFLGIFPKMKEKRGKTPALINPGHAYKRNIDTIGTFL